MVGKTEVNKVYDPACGSGSLLLKFAKVLGNDNVRQGFFGQEINLTTYNLARINMFLHDVNYEQFDLAHGDTLLDPAHWDDEPFEAIVSNPPYSIRWDGDANPLLINDPRFAPAGVLAPKSKADLAFTMHILSWLAVNGTAAIVEFPGVLYRGGAEHKIRKYLIDNNYVDTVIQLPPDLFFGTTIATCIIVLKKSKTDNATLFIDASAEFVRAATRTSSPRRTGRRSSTRSAARDGRRALRAARRQRRDRRERLQHRRLVLRGAGGHDARPSTSPRSTPRSPASSRGRPSCARRSTRSSRTWRARREPDRRADSGALPGRVAAPGARRASAEFSARHRRSEGGPRRGEMRRHSLPTYNVTRRQDDLPRTMPCRCRVWRADLDELRREMSRHRHTSRDASRTSG